MPNSLKTNLNHLYSKAISCREKTHTDLNHNHFAMIFDGKTVQSLGRNHKDANPRVLQETEKKQY